MALPPANFDVLGLGVTAVDDLLYVAEYPLPDTKTHVSSSERQCGGLTATALVAAARLGSACAYAGVLGEDDLSQYVLRRFEAEGIDAAACAAGRGTGRPIRPSSSMRAEKLEYFLRAGRRDRRGPRLAGRRADPRRQGALCGSVRHSGDDLRRDHRPGGRRCRGRRPGGRPASPLRRAAGAGRSSDRPPRFCGAAYRPRRRRGRGRSAGDRPCAGRRSSRAASRAVGTSNRSVRAGRSISLPFPWRRSTPPAAATFSTGRMPRRFARGLELTSGSVSLVAAAALKATRRGGQAGIPEPAGRGRISARAVNFFSANLDKKENDHAAFLLDSLDSRGMVCRRQSRFTGRGTGRQARRAGGSSRSSTERPWRAGTSTTRRGTARAAAGSWKTAS